MVVSMPRKGAVNTEPPDMVRVQLKPNDIRSYRRRDADEILAQTPGAFIIGEQEDDEIVESAPRAKRSAPNKARQTAPSKPTTPPADPPATPPADPPTGPAPAPTGPKAD